MISSPVLQNTNHLSIAHALVAVHRHPLRVSAQLTISSRTDWPAASMSTSCAALLECQQLLGTERLVVDLGRGLDQVLKVGAGEEVPEVDEFAVVLILDVDDP